jgi:DNA-binding transcriptional LysR family regulator
VVLIVNIDYRHSVPAPRRGARSSRRPSASASPPLGIAVLPREATAPIVAASGLAMVPLAERWAQRRFVACVRAEPALSASARRLVEHLRAAAAPPQRTRAAMKAR